MKIKMFSRGEVAVYNVDKFCFLRILTHLQLNHSFIFKNILSLVY